MASLHIAFRVFKGDTLLIVRCTRVSHPLTIHWFSSVVRIIPAGNVLVRNFGEEYFVCISRWREKHSISLFFTRSLPHLHISPVPSWYYIGNCSNVFDVLFM